MEIYLDEGLREKNVVLAIAEALGRCGENDTLHLGGGELVLDNTYANPTSYYLPRYTDRTKYYAVSLKNKRSLTIDGDGATLLLRGDVSAFEIEECESITLKNFKIDSFNPFFWQGLITECTDEYFDVEFDKEISPVEYDDEKKVFRLRASNPLESIEAGSLLVNEFDEKLQRPTLVSPDYFLCAGKPDPFYDFMSVVVSTEKIGDNKFRFRSKEKKITHTVGSYFVATSHERRNNNIHILKSRNVTLESIDMYASASFGVVSLLNENFNIRNVNSVLKPNSRRLLAVVADMFHCVNNRGTVNIEGCTMNNQKDDAVNVHSLLCEIETVLPDKHTAIVKFPYRAKRALNLFCSGENVHTLTSDTFEETGELTVLGSEFCGQYHLKMRFSEELCESMEGLFIESVDAMPKINVIGCSLGNNRGRGILVSSSRETVISNNHIYCQGPGVVISAASKFYMEGGAVKDVKIQGNLFDDCAYRKSAAVYVAPANIDDKRESFYHSNVSIVGNTFRLRGEKVIEARLVSGLYASDNIYENIEDKSKATPMVLVSRCSNIECEGFTITEKN